jgi:hypothetical protein
MRFVLDRVAVGMVFIQVPRFCFVATITTKLCFGGERQPVPYLLLAVVEPSAG